MRILHLTDLHYQSDKKFQLDQNNLRDSLVKSLAKDEMIDYVLFTGDLVFSGKKTDDFDKAKDLLFNAIVKDVNVSKENIFICCGNHDVYREQELNDVAKSIESIRSNEELEDYIKKQEGRSFEASLNNIRNYNTFQTEFYNEFGIKGSDFINPLTTVHKRLYNNLRIGIVSINSAWRAIDSRQDRGNLLFPISQLKEATNQIKSSTDFRILIMHHPISDFKDWNASEIEDIIYNDYQLLFSGHVHKRKQSVHIYSDEGIFSCTAAATLSLEKESGLGYSVIEVDMDNYSINITNRLYNKSENIFYQSQSNSHTSIPVSSEKNEQNEFRKTLRKRFNEEIERANELFISYDEKDGQKGFLDIFTDPIIKNKTKAQIAESQSDTPTFNIDKLVSEKNNFVLYGRDKSGKTSILSKVLIDLLRDFTIGKIIPLYINYKEYKGTGKKLNIVSLLGRFYEINKAKSIDLPNKYSVKLLIDNLDPKDQDFNSHVNNYLEENKNVFFVATVEETIGTAFDQFSFDGRDFTNLYIHEISRPEVRSLTNKWPNLTPEKRELILEKIFSVLNQLNISANYWTVSLFIWIFEKNSEANIHNSFELIQLYIDNLLDRKRLVLDKNLRIDFEDLKTYLASLAHHLVIDLKDNAYTASYSELVKFTEQYRSNNIRFVMPIEEIIDLIIENSILKKEANDRYTFRLNGVFEYFIAYHMNSDSEFRQGLINDDHYYLSFGNEFELCSGFDKKNKKFVEDIFSRTKQLFKEPFDKYGNSPIDLQLQARFAEIYDVSIPLNGLGKYQKGLPVEKQDELLEEFTPQVSIKSEVKEKQFYDTIEPNTKNLEKTLFILSRVFRNSSINDRKLNNDIVDFILDSACYLGFALIDEVGKDSSSSESKEEDENVLLEIVLNFMPLMVQTFLFEALAQSNLERIFKEKIEELKTDKKNNQFKLLVLYFTLIDLNFKTNKSLINEIVELINLGILKQTTILKLYVYLMFKCSGNKELEKFINEKIQQQTLKINPETDKGLIHQGLARAKKMTLLRKNRRR